MGVQMFNKPQQVEDDHNSEASACSGYVFRLFIGRKVTTVSNRCAIYNHFVNGATA